MAVASHLERIGLQPDIYALDDVAGLKDHPAYWPGRDYTARPNVVARRPGRGGGRSLVLSGHVDTVPLGTQPWCHDPFGGELDAGRLYGLGAYDMKGGLATILGVMRTLQLLDVPLRGDVIAESVVDEEFGGVNGTLAGRVRGDNGDAMVIPEPSGLTIHNGVRGGRVAHIRLVGHEGIFFDQIEPGQAIRQLTHLLRWVDVFRQRRRAHDPLGPAAPRDPAPVWVTKVFAGGWGMNVPLAVPAEVKVELYWQLLPGERQEQVEAEFFAWLDEMAATDPGCFDARPEVYFPIRFMPASELPADHPFIRTLADCAQAVTRERPAVAPLPSPSDMFVVHRDFAIPAVHYGPGGAGAHAADEYVLVNDLVTATKVLTLLVLAWCELA
jgi:acetylornithine deacetylase